MSSSKKNIYAWLIMAVAAVLIAGGLRVMRGQRLMKETDTVVETVTKAVWENETSARASTNDISHSSDTEPSESFNSAAYEENKTNESNINTTQYGPFIRILGIISFLIGCGAFITVLILLQQEEPLIGPDGVMILVGLTIAFKLYDWNYVIGLSLFIFVLFISLRELVGWAKHRFRLSWLISIRIAYLLTQLAYGRDLRHFSAQLERFQAGMPIEIGDGLYADMETKLLQMQQEHAKAIQDAVASERFKVDLITNVSHDLRTPLTAIIGYGELLQNECISEKGTESLEQLNRKAGYMKSLVEDLFELTKVSSGVIDPVMKELDLVSLLEQTIGLLQDELDAADLVVKRQYSFEKLRIVTDGGRMHQVFANLLENACKYALHGSRIYVYLDKDEKQIRVRIVNIASYEMDFTPEEIIQRFVRGDKARSTQGSGIGLAIAQTYTESVGGSFEIEIDGDQFSAIVCLPDKLSDGKTEN